MIMIIKGRSAIFCSGICNNENEMLYSVLEYAIMKDRNVEMLYAVLEYDTP